MPWHASLVAGLVVVAGLLPAEAAEIKGRVFKPGGAAGGVTVAVVPYEAPLAEALREARYEARAKDLASTLTRADGTFTLLLSGPALPPGTPLRIVFSGPGIAPATLADVIDSASSDDVGELRFEAGGPLAGRVLNARGAPVAGALVTLWPANADEALEPQPLTISTGTDGTFKFALASERGNRLRVEAPGQALVELARLRSGALAKPIVLSPGRSADGLVLRSDQRTPAVGSVVRYEGQGASRWVEVGPGGAFHVDGLPAGAGALVADGGELGRISAPFVEGARARLVLAPTAALKGRVVDATSAAPIARIRVVARAEGSTFVARSGPDGRYALRGLPVQRYRLSADDPRYVPWNAEVTHVAAAGTVSKDVALTLAATLSGRVVDEDGLPLEGARGMFGGLARGPRGLQRSERRNGTSILSGPDGTFTATQLTPGPGQILRVFRQDYEPRVLGGMDLRPGANPKLTVVLGRGQTLVGTVRDQADRTVADARVALRATRPLRGGRGAARMPFMEAAGAWPIASSKATTADGRFELRGLVSGEYSLVVSKAGYGQESVGPVTVEEGKNLEPVEVRLRSGATISGVVRDKSGKGVEGVGVLARSKGARSLGAGQASEPTEGDGTFTIDGLVAGESYDLVPMSGWAPPSATSARQAAIAAPAEGVELVIAGKGTIKGFVTDEDSERALTDFEVSYAGAGGFMRFGGGGGRRRASGPNQPESVHAADGQFTLADVPAGTWDVVVTAEGYQPGRASGVVVEENDTVESVSVALQRGAEVRGRVLDTGAGKPIVDAQVRARLQGESRGGSRFAGESDGRSASTDADGRFELRGLPPGSYGVSASHPEYSEITQTVVVKEQPTSVELRLGKGGALAGVVSAGGRPVGGASVGLVTHGESGPGRGFGDGQTFITDDAGRFRFEHLTPGRYSVMASLRADSSSPAEVVLLAGQSREDVVLTLGAGATIRGHVVGLSDQDQAGVNVSASGPEDYRASARTDSGGGFSLSGAPSGQIDLRAMTGDFGSGTRTAMVQVTVPDGQAETTAEIRFEPGFRIDGHVTRAGQGVPDAFVGAFGAGGRSSSARTDADGAYALEGLPEGSYRVAANGMPGSGGGAFHVDRAITLTGDMSVDLEAPAARLAGIVVDGTTHRPLADASVQVVGGGRGLAATDSLGRFALEGLEARLYAVSVQKPAYQTETRELKASEDSEVTFELVRGEGIGLVAHDGIFGTPLRSVQVRVLDALGLGVYGGSVPLDSEGRGEIPSLPPGNYRLRADAAGYAPVSLPSITVPVPALTLTLTPGGSLEIRPAPEAPEVSVRILNAAGQVYLASIYSGDGSISLHGTVRRLDNVVPGAYVLSVNGGDGPRFDVREGEPTVVQLR